MIMFSVDNHTPEKFGCQGTFVLTITPAKLPVAFSFGRSVTCLLP